MQSSYSFRGNSLGYLYPVIIASAISIFRVLNLIYPDIYTWALTHKLQWLAINFPLFVSDGDKRFIAYFVEWFGVIYGLMLPLVLVRTWEQFDNIEREFDKEADAIKVLSEDIMLLADNKFEFKRGVVGKLIDYVEHVLAHFKSEPGNAKLQKKGDDILKGIRKDYNKLLRQTSNEKEDDALVLELLQQLNQVIDTRGDRISTSTQRLFETLHLVTLFTSIIFIVPFYFIDLRIITGATEGVSFGLFGYVLIGSVTALVIFILTLIQDLDEPFHGKWSLEPKSWDKALNDLIDDIKELGVEVVEVSNRHT
ncbi:MAG: DUF4239 domain-containing protein [Anaerolineales bacterium]|nr:DUF4239 domain-containing protein [Anaerolineales bacterium]